MERSATHVLFPVMNVERMHQLGPNFTFRALSHWCRPASDQDRDPHHTTVFDTNTNEAIHISQRTDLNGLRQIVRFTLPNENLPPDQVTVLARREVAMTDNGAGYIEHDWFVGSTLAWNPVRDTTFDLIARHDVMSYRPYGHHIEEPTIIRVSGPSVNPENTDFVEAAVLQIGQLVGDYLIEQAA